MHNSSPAEGASSAAALAAIRLAGASPIVQYFRGAIIAFDRELRFLSAGGLGLADVGLSRERLEGNTIFEVFPPDVVTVIEPLYRQALAGGESSMDVPFMGNIYLLRLGPLRAADGEIVGGMGFTQNVTAERQHERELHETELRFRLAFKYAPIAKALIGLDERYELVNPAMEVLTGYPAEQLAGLSVADITEPADLAAEQEAMAALLANECESFTLDIRYRTASGAVVWGETSATLVRRADGSPLHFIAQIQDITARKLNEEALLSERRRLRAAESIGRVGSWELNLDSRAITWSAGMFELWGIDPDNFDGSIADERERVQLEDRPALDAAVQACAADGTPFQVRYRITRRGDDSLRWIDVRGAAFRENGRLVRIGGALADVTDRVIADQEASKTRIFQQAVLNAMPDIIAVWDFRSGSITWENHSITEVLGYSERDLAGVTDLKTHLVYGPDLTHFDAVMQAIRTAPTDQVIAIDYRMVAEDGSLHWLSRRTAPIERDEQGRVSRIVGVIRDITEEKVAEAALEQSEARFREMAESVNVGFILRSLDPPKFLYVSPGYRRIAGQDPLAADEDPATAFRRDVLADDRDLAQAQYWAKAEAGEAAQSEFRIVRPDGEVRWVQVTSAPVVDSDGVVRRTAITGEDITERKQAQSAQLAAENRARANALRSDFLSRMSHELRTPLNAVLGFGQLLELDDLTSTQQDAVQHILDGGRTLVGLVDDIFDITKLHGGHPELLLEAVEIDGLLSECLLQMMPAAVAAEVTLQYAAGPTGVLVHADRQRLFQVVNNLLSTAIEANRRGGQVELTSVLSAGVCLDIIVSDTGHGVGGNHLFVPLDPDIAEGSRVEGSGLGLTVSRDLLTAMGGNLHVTFREDIGSTFTASISLAGA